ncbi:MAG: FtsX-like permease family protein [Thermoanaerobaculia bacterium]
MHLGPIFRALMHSKARFWLVMLEVALTLAIVANCVNLMLDLRGKYVRETGIDEGHIIVVETEPFAPEFKEDEYVDEVQRADLERLRSLPGVAAAAAFQAIPLSGGGSATGRRAEGSEENAKSAPYFLVSDQALQTLGVEISEGRDFQTSDWDYEEDEDGNAVDRVVIMSRALADNLFPDGDALGRRIENSDRDIFNTIVGIVDKLPNSWPDWDEGREWTMLFPGRRPGSERQMRYLVRTEPGAVDAVYEGLEQSILDLNPGRIVTLKTMDEVKRRTFSSHLAVNTMLTALIGLLVLVTSLGIVGLTAFSVAQRRRQIGTRRALGATRGDILRYFLVENWMITGMGLAVGVALAYGLNFLLTHVADAPKMPWALIVGGMAMLWVTGILAALVPAWRATQVAPEVATRTI